MSDAINGIMQRQKTLRSVALETLDDIGFRDLARRTRTALRRSMGNAKRAIHARTQWGWRPLVPAAEFSACCVNAIRTLHALDPREPVGDYVEFGVSRGTSLACMSRALADEQAPNVRLFGFDSFRGLPPQAASEGWKPGAFHSTRAATTNYLKHHAANLDRIVLIEGWFDQTLNRATLRRHGLTRASLIMLDCDTYTASRQALSFAKSLIKERAVIFCDDWGARSTENRMGQRDAFHELLRGFARARIRELPSYRATSRVFLLETG